MEGGTSREGHRVGMEMRLAWAGLILVFAIALFAVLARDGADGGARGRPGLVVDSPPGLLAACRSATASARMPPRCPAVVPVPNGQWGRSRALDNRPCQYLIDVEPGPDRGAPDRQPIFHLLFGGRCRPFDLTAAGGRWPAKGFITDGLRLVGLRPLHPGETGRPDGFAPARPRVLARLRVGTSPALLVRQRSYPLTTVHSGHLAIVWNESNAGYTVSGHPSEPRTARQRRLAVRALKAMAVGMRAPSR